MSRLCLLFVFAIACGDSGSAPLEAEAAPASAPTPTPTPAAHSGTAAPAAQRPVTTPPSTSKPPEAAPGAPAYAASRGRSIQWKRNAAFEADLMRGLDLTRDELCQELGTESCIRTVHTVALGGNDPFGSGLLRPAHSSLSTTPLAVDRVTLSACSQRARADKQGSPKLFSALDLAGAAPLADSDAFKATITTLFRRLLARDPKPSELTTLAGLVSGDGESMNAEEFATLACFTVASSLESLFF
jgi:hypothetical protein